MKKILVSYPYFLPAFKAGGPVQSIANFARQMAGSYDIYAICMDTDLGDSTALAGIEQDTWTDFEDGTARVYYISKENLKRSTIQRLINEVAPDYIFINGLYSLLFSIVPLFYKRSKKIISVRGMLHPGALSQKRLKKSLFITAFKWLGIPRKVTFHATDDKEAGYIKDTFGTEVHVQVADNFPLKTTAAHAADKKDNQLKLVSIALISPMKNHLLVLEALQKVNATVVYDIYGPVKDQEYWAKCKKVMESLPAHITVTYRGEMQPAELQRTLSQYHAFMLPSKSENFGHAIYEALASGLPVITSYFTPWNNLEAQKAGFNADVSDASSISASIEKLAVMDAAEFSNWQSGAVVVAEKAIDFERTRQQYHQLFGSL